VKERKTLFDVCVIVMSFLWRERERREEMRCGRKVIPLKTRFTLTGSVLCFGVSGYCLGQCQISILPPTKVYYSTFFTFRKNFPHYHVFTLHNVVIFMNVSECGLE